MLIRNTRSGKISPWFADGHGGFDAPRTSRPRAGHHGRLLGTVRDNSQAVVQRLDPDYQ